MSSHEAEDISNISVNEPPPIPNIPDTDKIDTPAYWSKLRALMIDCVNSSISTITPRIEKNECKIDSLEKKIHSLEETVNKQSQVIESLKTLSRQIKT